MTEVLEFEILDNDNIPIEMRVDFEGDFVSGATAEDYQRGYEEGYAQGLIDGQAKGYQNGYDEGHKVGYLSGYDTGKTDGLTEGYDNGYTQGKIDGYKAGYDEGYSKGYSDGYEKGKAEGDDNHYEIIHSIFNGTITEFFSLEDLTAHATQEFGCLFNGCNKMTKWSMPNLTKTLRYAFRYCSRLTYIDIGKPTECLPTTFYGRPLTNTSVVIRSETPPSLSGGFSGTNIDNTTIFYVPKNSIDLYKNATNWSIYADCYRAIEDYPDITGGIM